MGTGKRYTVTSVAQVKAALIDRYGAYDESLNPDGVTVYYESSSSIIFSCLAICDKVIRFYDFTRGYCSYGDSWTSGDAVDNEMVFGGNNYWQSTANRDLILSDNCFVANWYRSSDTTRNSGRLIVIGKLSNGKYFCAGGYQSSTYQANLRAYITDGNIDGLPITGQGTLMSPSGEIYKSKIYFGSNLGEAQVNTDGSLAYLLDVETAYYQSIHLAATESYVLTSSICTIGAENTGFINSLIIELQQ